MSSGIELIRVIEKIKDLRLSREERLKAIISLSKFEAVILEPNLKLLLLALTELAKRIEAGSTKEMEFFGVLLIQISKISRMIHKHIKKIFSVVKLIVENFPKTLEGFGLIAALVALKNFVFYEHDIIFDQTVKKLITRSINLGIKDIMFHALDTMFTALWAVPWALNEYLDVIKPIIDNTEHFLHDRLFKYLSVIGRKNFYSLRPIINAILEKYTDILGMPESTLFFIASLTIPIREQEYLRRIGKILEEVIIRHKNVELRAQAIVNYANIFRHPKFKQEKKNLLKMIDTLLSIEEHPTIIISCIRALATTIWRGIIPPEDLVRRLLNNYYKIPDNETKKSFIDAVLLAYSSIPEISDVIIDFSMAALVHEKNNIDIMWELQKMLSSIAISEIKIEVLYKIANKVFDILQLPESQFSVSLRVLILEQVLLSIAKREPRVIVDLADRLISGYKQTPCVSIFDCISKIIFETLKRYPLKNENCLKLLKILFEPPELDATYDTILKYLVSLSAKYREEIARKIFFLAKIFRTIKEIAVTIEDVREKYFVVDESIKNLARLLTIIMKSLPLEYYDALSKLIVAMYATETGAPLRDILYTLMKSKEVPKLFEYVKNYLGKITLSDRHKELLRKIGL